MAGGVVVAAAVAIILAVTLAAAGPGPAVKTKLPGAGDVQLMFKGIPQSGTTLGSQSAP